MAYRVLLIFYGFAKSADIEFPRKKVQRLGKQQVGWQIVKYYPENASLYIWQQDVYYHYRTTTIIIYHTFPCILRMNQCMSPGCMFTCHLIVGGDSLGQLVNSQAPEIAIWLLFLLFLWACTISKQFINIAKLCTNNCKQLKFLFKTSKQYQQYTQLQCSIWLLRCRISYTTHGMLFRLLLLFTRLSVEATATKDWSTHKNSNYCYTNGNSNNSIGR